MSTIFANYPICKEAKYPICVFSILDIAIPDTATLAKEKTRALISDALLIYPSSTEYFDVGK